ncbi:hypothetical protein D5125_17195 [Magnetovirga frankeli]|uniref:hypothetical protein n=1 Tax=Magnetovirga frankeli TaxID=947516 RepID=UPI0012940E6D|nr:hypothetical protein D5125_17195 [gamma proteobacterium SS-5]
MLSSIVVCHQTSFVHDYPDTVEERFERLQLVLTAARRLLEILAGFEQKVQQTSWPWDEKSEEAPAALVIRQ